MRGRTAELLVLTQYGFGWTSSSGKQAEVPKAFRLLARELRPGLLVGSVQDGPHPLASQWVALLRRTREGDPTYNVYVFPHRPDDVIAAIEPGQQMATLTGFASLRRRAAWLSRLLSRLPATK